MNETKNSEGDFLTEFVRETVRILDEKIVKMENKQVDFNLNIVKTSFASCLDKKVSNQLGNGHIHVVSIDS